MKFDFDNIDTIVNLLVKWKDEKKLEVPSVSEISGEYEKSPWAILVSTLISLRTKDATTLRVSRRLLKEAPTPQKYLALTEERATELLYGAGFYNTKQKSIRDIAAILLQKYQGKVPADMDALLALPGVGRKTANLVLIEAFDIDGICVDTHVHRISNRLGIVKTKTPDETEMELRKILPKKHWKTINHILVLYGQNQCKPRNPLCKTCIIKKYCVEFYKEYYKEYCEKNTNVDR
jgi:endonuclease-3